MAGITQAVAQANLDAAIAALVSARKGETEIKDRKKKPATVQDLIAEVKFWKAEVKEAVARGSRTGPTMKGGTPA